jgi:tRNA threonylcarbamoyl adenosine modification protein YjeE
MSEINFICDEAGSVLLARLFAKSAKAGDCFALSGDLGAGKSTFARAFIQELCGDVNVTSPTFTISQNYTSKEGLPIWHYDLYRIKSADELFEIAIDEVLHDSITIIEWPEITKMQFHTKTIHITFAFSDKSSYRCVEINHYN